MPLHSNTEASTTSEKATEERKRKRDVLSCLDCRRRKLKCDRAYPVCTRCQKGGNASSCTYKSIQNGDAHGSDGGDSFQEGGEKRQRISTDPVNGSSVMNRLQIDAPPPMSTVLSQEKTIKRLESRLADVERLVARSSAPRGEAQETKREPETMFFKGRGFRTQFYGPSLPTTQLAHFPEVRTLMKELHSNSDLKRIQREERGVSRHSAREIKPDQHPELTTLVPERARTDHFVQLYFRIFENTFRILHQPTFSMEYETFWTAPQACRPGFVPVLLLVMATVSCMSPENKSSFITGGSSGHREAVSWILSCDAWLRQQSQKHRTIEMYQVMCLRVLAASATSLKTKQHYTGVENLLTYFRSAGMHRDPSLLGDKCSTFDREMRRRLWATVMELEIQASIDRGAPSTLSAIPVDCKPPENLNDEDLVDGIIEIPAPKPVDHYTSTSFLLIASRSLPLRISLCSVVNDPNSDLLHEDVLRYEQQIRDELDAVPRWTDPRSDAPSILLEIQLRQFLIILHSPFARQNGPQARYSRMVCFETSKKLLDQHSMLTASGNFSLAFTREDVFRAALSICHNAFLCTLDPNDFFFSGVMASFSSMMDMTFKFLEEGGMRRGQGFHQLWYASAASSLVEMKMHPEQTKSLKLLATARVVNCYQMMMDAWEKVPIPQTPASLLPSANQPLPPNASSWYYSANSLGFVDAYGPTPPAIPELDQFDTSDWTLDNLWPMDDIYDSIANT